jgi:aspartate carbamoyltransferase catalytic subunit
MTRIQRERFSSEEDYQKVRDLKLENLLILEKLEKSKMNARKI